MTAAGRRLRKPPVDPSELRDA